MDRIRLVTLDMVGTVIKFSHPPVAQYQRVAARYVVSYLLCIVKLGLEPPKSLILKLFRLRSNVFDYLMYFLVMDMKLSSTLWLKVSSISGRQ